MKESADKNNPQTLEDLFRTRMEAAEAAPSERVWERIEQGLDLKEAGYYKERVNWYRSVAAACVVLVMGAALYLFYAESTRSQSGQTGAAWPPPTTIAGNHNSAASPEKNQLEPASRQPATAQATRNRNAAPVPPGLATTTPATRPMAENKAPATTANPKPLGNTPSPARPTGQSRLFAGRRNQDAGTRNATLANRHIISRHKENRALSATDETQNNNQVALTPVSARAILRARALPTDSLWRPRAIVATPPTLAGSPAATPEPAATKISRWSFSAKYAPQYFNQNLELAAVAPPQYLTAPNSGNFSAAPAASVNAAGYSQALQEYDRNTASGFSYNAAAAVGYALNEHWSLEAGLLFTQNVAISQSSYVFNNSYLTTRYSNADPTTRLSDTKNLMQATALPTTALVASLAGQQHLGNATVVQTPTFATEYRYRSAGIPLKLNYQTNHRKSFYFASVGLLTNLLVQANIIAESSQVPDIKFGHNPASPFRLWQVATVLAAGKGFRVSEAINLKAGLEGTQYLTSLAAHPENLNSKQRKPYTIGVAFSSSYTLGR